MKKVSTTLLVFGVYLVGMGLGLLTMPNVVLGMLGFPPTDEIWIRVLSVVTLVLAYYYISASRADLKTFAEWTVPTRIGVFVAFTAFVLLKFAGPVMIMLGSVDLLGALWTAWALRAEK
jgi:hypothetical protein